MRQLFTLVIAALLTIGIFSPLANAQTASINGTVNDPSGALVENAKVSARNMATNATREVRTGNAGIYNLTELPPGSYELTIEKTGFRPLKYQAITLTVDQALTLNAKLEIGSNAEQVTVEGATVAPINTTDAQVSNVIDEKQMEALPLILRDPYQLVLLTPGTTYTNDGSGGFSINGGRSRNNNFMLDGTNNNDAGVPGSGFATLNPDATQEFRVITNDYLPEFGRNSFGVVDIVSRSGTNDLHGDVYYFGRWDALGARDFFNNASTGGKDFYNRNIFGASLGGPVIKNKLFFFFNYEGNRFDTSTVTIATVPTAQFKTGNFTYVDPTAGPVPINVSTPNSANNAFNLALDPQTQKLLNYYPAANGPAVQPGVSAQYLFADPDILSSNNYLGKIDYTINQKNNISVRYLANQSNDNGASGDSLPGIGGAATHGLIQSTSGHWTSTLSPTRQNDFFANANRGHVSFPCNGLTTINSLGDGTDVLGRGRDWELPGFANIACSALGDSDLQVRPYGIFTIGDNFTWIKGRHTLKFGYEYDDSYENGFNDFGTRDTPSFFINLNTGGFSALANTVSFNNEVVQDAVWGLLGGVYQDVETQLFTSAGNRVPSDERGMRERDMYGFIQDQFKVKSNLTLNYGLRYEWDGVPWEVHNQLYNASNATLLGPAPLTFTQVTRGGANPLYVNDPKGFEPRVGFAWDPFKDGKTSIRGGYGIARDRQFFNVTGNIRGNLPLSFPYTNSVFFDTFGNSGFTGPLSDDQISNIAIPGTQPAPSASVPNFPASTCCIFPQTVDPNFRVPYVQQWNLGIQRQLGAGLTLELNYVGNKANRLYRIIDGNPPNNGLIAQLRAYCADPTYPQRLQVAIANNTPITPNPNNIYGCIDNPIARPQDETVQGTNLYVGNLVAGNFSGITGLAALPSVAVQNSAALHANTSASLANSNSNALQATLSKQFSHGMSFQANYTFAHAIDDASDGFLPQQGEFPFPANSGFLNREKGNSSYDVRNRFVLNYNAELPFGRGKSYLNSGVAGRALEGWSWSGIATVQTGFPFEIFESGVDSDGTGAQQRASYSTAPTNVPFQSGRPVTGPNAGLFTFPLFGGPGTVRRNSFHGPGFRAWDMVLTKNTKLSERMSLEFRSEFYNILNHPTFQQPDQFINDATFGESSAQVGRPDGTTGARQIQFAMKLKF
jgi:hypothetical protein